MEKKYYEEYARLETSHWWFKARLNILSGVIQKQRNGDHSREYHILNVGVATGQTTKMLERFGKVTSLEYDKDCCEYLRTMAGIDVIQGSLTELPFENNEFDLVCAFDVIEHIDNDQRAIDEIYRVLRPNGKVIITVPAFMFLWSEHDEINLHFRRYTRPQLKKLLEGKFETQYISYFNFILFPLVFILRVFGQISGLRKKGKKELQSDFEFYKTNKYLSHLFYFIFNFEKRLIGKIRLPYGVSIISINNKTEKRNKN